MDTNVLGIRFAEILADIEQWTEKFCELPKQAFSQQRQYFESNILRFENREFCTKEYLIVVLDGNEDPLHLLRAYVARYVLSNTFEQSNAVFANDGSEKSIDWPNGPPPPGIKKTLDWLIETSQLLGKSCISDTSNGPNLKQQMARARQPCDRQSMVA